MEKEIHMTQGNREREWDGKEEEDGVLSEVGNKFFENQIARGQKVSLGDFRWLTTSEAAQYLRVSADGLKTMVYRGKIRAHKLGRRNRFLREELDRLIVLPVQDWRR